MLAARKLASLILWGPPGCGKTTIARLLAEDTDLHFEPLSAVFSGVADLRRIFEAARKRRKDGQGTLLFVDEIHRFNRAQQDGFLPYVEDGTVTLIGATTENPSFELNGALLSRCQVWCCAVSTTRRCRPCWPGPSRPRARNCRSTRRARQALFAMADGDGRYLIGLAEQLAQLKDKGPVPPARLATLLQNRAPLYDKAQEAHYNLISALHKSLRGSDVDAALYWFSRMLDGGEDPKYIARRLVRFAVEDIGMADPNALTQTLAAWDTYDRLGSPEGELAIAQAVIYLGTAPKSNSGYTAFGAAKRAAKTARLADAADAHPECADQAHEGDRLRQGLRVRPQCRGWLLGTELLPRRHGARGVLPAGRTRLRARDPEAPGILEEAAREEALTKDLASLREAQGGAREAGGGVTDF